MAGLALTPISGGKGRTALEDIDDTVKDTIDEAVVYFEDRTGRLQTEPFTDKEAAEDWLSDARAYAYQRPADVDGKTVTGAGRVVVSGNSARAPGNTAKDGTGPYVVRFTVEPYVAPAPAAGE